MSIRDEVLKANNEYAATFGQNGELGLPPAREFAILTCMDARLIPPNMPAWPRAMHTSSAMPEAGPATTRSVPW
jgi:hypothetical protein